MKGFMLDSHAIIFPTWGEILFGAVLLLILVGANVGCRKKETVLEVPLPIDAIEAKTISKTRASTLIEYRYKPISKSQELLNYYDSQLKEKGWIPYIEEYYSGCDRKWISLDGTLLLTAYWVDKNRTKRISVTIGQSNEVVDTILGATTVEQRIIYEEGRFYEIPFNEDFYLKKYCPKR